MQRTVYFSLKSPLYTAAIALPDETRCSALNLWFVSKVPRLWLKPSSEPKIWVNDAFRPPDPLETTVELEVRFFDLSCFVGDRLEDKAEMRDHERTLSPHLVFLVHSPNL